MKHFSFVATAATVAMLASCTSEVIPELQEQMKAEYPIEFKATPGNMTRANVTGSTAAGLLSNKFIVYGQKTVGNDVSAVFAGVPVEYTSEWSYVTNSQALRYWDTNASGYDFYAYSDANNPSIITPAANVYTGGVTVAAATAENMAKVHTTAAKSVTTSAFTSPVTFTFKNAAAKVRVAFINAIPGYDVNVDKFYVTADTETQNTTLKGTFYLSAGYTIAANGTQAVSGTPTTMTDLTLGNLIVQSPLANQYISKDVTTPSFDKAGGAYTWVLPTQGAGQDINLKVTYRMISGHDIITRTVNVTVPAVYAKWEPNYAYTYFFKITDNDLHPITFDAEVVNFEDNTSETVTTIDGDNPVNITTWAEGSNVQGDGGYKKGSDIYVSVKNCPTTFDVHTGFTTEATINGSNAGSKIASDGWTLRSETTGGRYLINATEAGFYVVRVSWTVDSVTKYAYKVIKVVE